jgi:hypothetical protein
MDLEGLRNAVVDAASVGTGLWFSYLFVLFYLAVAVVGVTHRAGPRGGNRVGEIARRQHS